MPQFSSVSETINHFSDQPIVDDEQIEMLKMVDEGDDTGGGLVAELFGLFKEESSAKLNDLSPACAANDTAQFRKIIHFIAGSAGNIGFMRLNVALRAVEEGIDLGRITDVTSGEASVRNLFDISCRYMAENHG